MFGPWIPWAGGPDCPVPAGVRFNFRFRSDGQHRVRGSHIAPYLRWTDTCDADDIVAYQMEANAEGWIPHTGYGFPADLGATRVEVRLRSGRTGEGPANMYRTEQWSHSRSASDIVAYRLHTTLTAAPSVPVVDDNHGWLRLEADHCPVRDTNTRVDIILHGHNNRFRPELGYNNREAEYYTWYGHTPGRSRPGAIAWWRLARPGDTNNPDLNFGVIPNPVQPEMPSPRPFDCPGTSTQCTRPGCTPIHCETQIAAHNAKPITPPARRRIPRPTGGDWSVQSATSMGGTVFFVTGSGGRAVAACSNGILANAPATLDTQRANAVRIASLPEIENILRDMAYYFDTDGGRRLVTDQGHQYQADFTSRTIALLRRWYTPTS